MRYRWIAFACLALVALAGCETMRQAGTQPPPEKQDTGGGGY
jgi:hypothetical protein